MSHTKTTILILTSSFVLISLLPIRCSFAQTNVLKLVPQRVSLSGNRSFDLNLPSGFGITPAAQGLKRVRFMATSPEGRVFVTDMYNLSDNTRGVVYILEDFDPETRTFKKVTPYLKGLRNPNSIAFHTDARGVELVLSGFD